MKDANFGEAEDRYITPTEVVALAGLSPEMLRKLEGKGRFPKRLKLSARTTRWYLPDVLSWKADPENWTQDKAINKAAA